MSKDMTGREKLLFIVSFLWMLHWGTRVVSILVDMVILNSVVKTLPLGL
tara:strand:+ start:211 stop:357 length:147 start_codon:yes stop_codon:yes gene_type:complete